MLADELDYVLSVDTHRDEHVLAVVTAHLACHLYRLLEQQPAMT